VGPPGPPRVSVRNRHPHLRVPSTPKAQILRPRRGFGPLATMSADFRVGGCSGGAKGSLGPPPPLPQAHFESLKRTPAELDREDAAQGFPPSFKARAPGGLGRGCSTIQSHAKKTNPSLFSLLVWDSKENYGVKNWAS